MLCDIVYYFLRSMLGYWLQKRIGLLEHILVPKCESEKINTLRMKRWEVTGGPKWLCTLFQIYHGSIGIPHDPLYPPIGLYRDVWIAAIASSTTSLATRTAAICVRFQGRRVRRVYVTMQITFLTRKSALIYRRGLRQRVASLTLNCNGDFAIRAYIQTYSTTPTSNRNANPRNIPVQD